MPSLMRATGSVAYRSARLQVREFGFRPLAIIVSALQPAAFLAIVLLARPVHEPEEVFRVTVGVGLLALWAVAVFTSGTILYQDRAEGTLTTVLLGTSRPFTVLVGRSLGAMLAAAVTITLSLGIMLALMGVMPTANWGLLSFIAIAVVISSVPLGLLLSSLIILSRAAMRVAEAMLYPVFVGSGVMIPLEMLPAPVGYLAQGFSLYWGNQLLRAAADGWVDLSAFAALVGLSAAYAVVGYVVFRIVVARGRVSGDLDAF